MSAAVSVRQRLAALAGSRRAQIVAAATALVVVLIAALVITNPGPKRHQRVATIDDFAGEPGATSPDDSTAPGGIAAPGANLDPSISGATGGPNPAGGPTSTTAKTCTGCSPAAAAAPILIGVPVTDNSQNDSNPNFPVKLGNVELQAKAMAADINSRGGLWGRQIKLDLVRVDDQGGQESDDDADRRHCVKFTEDDHVFAVVTYWMTTTLAQCLAQHHTVAFRTGNQIGDDQIVAQPLDKGGLYPWVWTSPDKSTQRIWSTEIPELKTQGYFDKRSGESDVKVGLVILDRPGYTNTVRDVVRPRLHDAGVADANIDEYHYTSSGSAFDFPALHQAGQAAAQKFHADGVNRVFFLPSFLVFNFFMDTAEHGSSPPYRPQYAVDSSMQLNGPVEKGTPQGKTPAAQLEGARGIGWNRVADLSGMRAGPYTSREQSCVDAMKKGGVQVIDRTNPALAIEQCEAFWAMEAAAGAAAKSHLDATGVNMVKGLESLGTSWESLMSFNVDFGRKRTDASFGHRLVAWKTDHFEYTSDVRPDS